jgi:iron-sulfur cluster insertion protein
MKATQQASETGMPDGIATGERALTITASAAAHVQKLIASEGDDALMLRIAVSGGGCSGFQYGFSLDTDTGPDDKIFEGHGAKVVIDDMSLDLLAGSEVDYVQDLIGSYFSIKNPNASSTCGCGSSFAV